MYPDALADAICTRPLAHDLLPFERPVLAVGANGVEVRQLHRVELLCGDDLGVGEALGPVGEVAASRAAEIGEAPRALDGRAT